MELFLDGKIDRTYSGEDTHDFNMSNLPQIVVDRVHQLFCDPMAACIDKKPIDGAYLLLHYLTFKNHEIGIVTSRPTTLHEATNYILWRDFKNIRFSLGVHFSNNRPRVDMAISKEEIIKKISPHVYVDDYMAYCKNATAANVNYVFLIRNKHTGWNKNINLELESIKEIKSVVQLMGEVDGL
jgi:hypothetical protein